MESRSTITHAPTIAGLATAPRPRSSHRPGVAVAIPIRAFALGKSRLADRLSADDRAWFARRCAEQVVEACGPLPVLVVSSDAAVLDWARARGLETIDDPGSLDAAADTARTWAAARGLVRLVVAHADLPRAVTFDALTLDGARDIVVAVPCHRDDGTPVLSVPVGRDFRFRYGPGSFRRHAAETRRLGAGLRVVRDPDLRLDVDIPEDLDLLDRLPPS